MMIEEMVFAWPSAATATATPSYPTLRPRAADKDRRRRAPPLENSQNKSTTPAAPRPPRVRTMLPRAP